MQNNKKKDLNIKYDYNFKTKKTKYPSDYYDFSNFLHSFYISFPNHI